MFRPLLFLLSFCVLTFIPWLKMSQRMIFYPLLLLIGFVFFVMGNVFDSTQSLFLITISPKLFVANTATLSIIFALFFSLIVEHWNRPLMDTNQHIWIDGRVKLFFILLVSCLGLAANNLHLMIGTLMILSLLALFRSESVLWSLIFLIEVIGFLIISLIGIKLHIFTFEDIVGSHYLFQILLAIFMVVYIALWLAFLLNKNQGHLSPLLIGKMAMVEFCLMKMIFELHFGPGMAFLVICLLVVLYFVFAPHQLSKANITYFVTSLIILVPIFFNFHGEFVLGKIFLLVLLPAFGVLEKNSIELSSEVTNESRKLFKKISEFGLIIVLLAIPISPFFIFYFELFNRFTSMEFGIWPKVSFSIYLLLYSILMAKLWPYSSKEQGFPYYEGHNKVHLNQDIIQLGIILSLLLMIFMVCILKNGTYKTDLFLPVVDRKNFQVMVEATFSNLYALFFVFSIVGIFIVYFVNDSINMLRNKCNNFCNRIEKCLANWIFLFVNNLVLLFESGRIVITFPVNFLKLIIDKLPEFIFSPPILIKDKLGHNNVEIIMGHSILLLIGLVLFLVF